MPKSAQNCGPFKYFENVRVHQFAFKPATLTKKIVLKPCDILKRKATNLGHSISEIMEVYPVVVISLTETTAAAVFTTALLKD